VADRLNAAAEIVEHQAMAFGLQKLLIIFADHLFLRFSERSH
jgi:hypothetical protein